MSVVANVAINIDGKQAAAVLDQIKRKVEEMNGTFSQVPRQTQAASGAFNQLIGTLGGVAAAYGQLRVAQKALQTGIQREESVRRLQFLAKGYNEITQAQLAAARAGQQFGFSATESNQQFAQLYGRLRPLNVSLRDIETAFIGFNTAAKVSGATSAESAGAFLQLTQALGSGVLRGQELNSVLEQAPGLVVALTKELGKPVSEIRKLAEQGQITSDVVIRALKRAGTDGAGQLEAAMQGPAQQVKNLQNAFEDFQVAVVQNLLPAVIGNLQQLTRILQTATQYVKDFAAGWSALGGSANAALAPFSGLIGIFEQIDSRLSNIAKNPGLRMLGSFMPGGVLAPILNAPADIGKKLRMSPNESGKYGRYIPGSQQVPISTGSAIGGTPSPTGGTAGKSKKGAGDAAANKAAQIQAEIQGLQRQVALTQQLTFLDEQIANAEADKDQQLVIRLQGEEKLLQLRYQLADELAKAETAGQRDAALAKATAEAERIRVGTAIELSKNEEERQQRFQDLLTGFEREIELSGIKDEAAKKLKQIEYDIVDLRKQGILLTDSEIEAYRRRAQAAGAVEKKSPAQKRMDELKKSIADLTDIENIAVSSADMMGAAFGQAFQDIANGSATAQEALAGMMKSIGENFVNMAAQIIAQQITMIILGSIMKALGLTMGSGGGGGGGAPNYSHFFSSEGMFGGGWGVAPPAFADGGFVTGPTQAIVGEGGQPEYIIPASKMQAAMARYSAGARGDAVIPSDSGTGAAGGTATMAAPTGTIDIRYTVERINTVDYVTADQFQRGMAQAAQQGAAQGEQRTLRRLQQSRTTRSRLGMA